MNTETTTCCIAGGGPAGIFLGYLLARSGVSVVVLEKHADFLRDFRGDTIHPSTTQLLDELGILNKFLPIVDFRADQLWINFDGKRIAGPSFAHLKTECKFIGFAPQWDFLNLLAEEANQFPGFDLRMSTKAIDVIREAGKVVGVRCQNKETEYEIRADLVVAADGRSSTLRAATDQPVIDTGVPIDALWFRLDRPEGDEGHTLGWIRDGHMLVTIPRRTHYQIAMVIRKGAFGDIQQAGLESFRETIATVCPVLNEVVSTLNDWDDVKLLTVQINHMEQWCEEGLLFIGDAAHAMSPMGGVGINLAIQDAVAAANHLVQPLSNNSLKLSDLEAIQQRRVPASRKTQRMQARMHKLLFGDSTGHDQAVSLPWYARMSGWLLGPLLRRLAGKWIGMGFQPEQIETKSHEM